MCVCMYDYMYTVSHSDVCLGGALRCKPAHSLSHGWRRG